MRRDSDEYDVFTLIFFLATSSRDFISAFLAESDAFLAKTMASALAGRASQSSKEKELIRIFASLKAKVKSKEMIVIVIEGC